MVALLPILVALVLMVGMNWPPTKAMPLAWLVCALGALGAWSLPVGYVAALSVQGIITAIGVLISPFWRDHHFVYAQILGRYGNHPVWHAGHQP